MEKIRIIQFLLAVCVYEILHVKSDHIQPCEIQLSIGFAEYYHVRPNQLQFTMWINHNMANNAQPCHITKTHLINLKLLFGKYSLVTETRIKRFM